MPLNINLPVDHQDGDGGHTTGHNTTNTAVNTTAAAVDGLTVTVAGKAAASHTHAVGDLSAVGTKDGTKFLRDDNTWAVPAGAGGSADLPEASATPRTSADATTANLLSKTTRYDTTGGAIAQTLPAATAGRVWAIGWDAGTAALTLTGASRTDTCGTTSGSATVTDTSITSADTGRAVTGAGIPAGSYVGTVTAVTSFLLSSSATSQVNVTATATAASVSLTISDLIGSGAVTSFALPLPGEILTAHCTTAGRWRIVSGFKPQASLDARYPSSSVSGGALGKLAQTAVAQVKQERLAGPAAGASATLATLTGTGCVETLWWVADCNATYNPGIRLQVFVDGESTPSVDAEVASLLFAGAGQADAGSIQPGFSLSTQHVHAEAFGSGNLTGYLLFPIPYSSGCVVKLYNPSGTSLTGGQIWSIVTYSAKNLPYRLRASTLPYVGGTPVTPDPHTFLHLSGTAGWLAWHGLTAQAATPTHLERNIDIFVDGETTASLPTSGGEDYFRSANYFRMGSYTGQLTSSSPASAWSASNAAKSASCALDWLALCGGVKFTTGIRVEWLAMDAPFANGYTDTVNLGYTMIWYEPYTSGATSTPSPPTNPTAVTGATSATASWAKPVRTGSSTITGYTIRAYRQSDNVLDATGTAGAGATSGTVSGLTNSTVYYFTVSATSSVGSSSESRATVATSLITAPSTPTIGTATAQTSTSATVAFTASTGSTPITYTATSSPGGITGSGTSSPVAVTGLTPSTSYTFTVVASNGAGSSGTSAASNSITTPAAGYDPTAITGLQLWLDAADGATLFTDTAGTTAASTASAPVARWGDKSGNARHATQSTSASRPLLNLAAQNGKNVLYFDGVDDSLLTGLNPSTALTNGFTILSVSKLDDTSSRGYSWMYGDSAAAGDQNVILLGKKGSADQMHFGAAGWHTGIDAGAGAFVGAYHQYGHQESNSVRRVLIDGTAITDTTNSSSTATATAFNIGRRLQFAELWKGPICELLVWNRVLTTTERQNAETYLKAKWGTP